MLERTTGIEPARASLATTRYTISHPRVGWCGWICTSYLRLIGPTRICMCFTPSTGRNGRTRTYIGRAPKARGQPLTHIPDFWTFGQDLHLRLDRFAGGSLRYSATERIGVTGCICNTYNSRFTVGARSALGSATKLVAPVRIALTIPKAPDSKTGAYTFRHGAMDWRCQRDSNPQLPAENRIADPSAYAS